jgi:hypothetical protein
MSARVHRLLVSMMVLGLTGAVAGAGTYAAFWSRAENPSNRLEAGTVYLSNNATGVILTIAGARPSDPPISGCVVVTYGGNLDAAVKLYGSTTGDIAPYLNLTVETGTTSSPFNSCATFSASGTLYDGLLSAYPTDYAAGIADPDAAWTSGEQHAYRITVSVTNVAAAQGRSGEATFTWEARNL